MQGGGNGTVTVAQAQALIQCEMLIEELGDIAPGLLAHLLTTLFAVAQDLGCLHNAGPGLVVTWDAARMAAEAEEAAAALHGGEPHWGAALLRGVFHYFAERAQVVRPVYTLAMLQFVLRCEQGAGPQVGRRTALQPLSQAALSTAPLLLEHHMHSQPSPSPSSFIILPPLPAPPRAGPPQRLREAARRAAPHPAQEGAGHA